jgi:hypothetical protein
LTSSIKVGPFLVNFKIEIIRLRSTIMLNPHMSLQKLVLQGRDGSLSQDLQDLTDFTTIVHSEQSH